LADVNAVIAVSGMTDDPFILFEECIHGRPCEGDPSFQDTRVVRQIGVLPCGPLCVIRRQSVFIASATDSLCMVFDHSYCLHLSPAERIGSPWVVRLLFDRIIGSFAANQN
jgi:hypothetical protein